MNTELVVIIGLCAFLVLGYGAGYLFNRRLGQRLYGWLRPGMEVLGQGWQSTWFGSSSVRLSAQEPATPFQQVEAILLLENREIPVFWLLNRLGGRRDWLILKATFAKAGAAEVEVIPAGSRIAQGLRQQVGSPWKVQEGPHGLAIACRGAGAQQLLSRLEPWLATYGAALVRLSWRREAPHVQMQLRVNGLLDRSSTELLDGLQRAVHATAAG